MTNKEQIIIDGVDVSDCNYIIAYDPPKEQGTWGGAIHKGACKIYSKDCKYNSDCYFKQLARKTQECELAEQLIAGILKTLNLEAYDWRADQNEILTEIRTFIEKNEALKLENQEGYEIVDELKQECEELKEKYKEYVNFHNYSNAEFEQERDSLIQEILYKKHYRKALEELEEEADNQNKRWCKAWLKVRRQRTRYLKALEEVEEIATDIVENDCYENSDTKANKILDIINKAKEGNNENT